MVFNHLIFIFGNGFSQKNITTNAVITSSKSTRRDRFRLWNVIISPSTISHSHGTQGSEVHRRKISDITHNKNFRFNTKLLDTLSPEGENLINPKISCCRVPSIYAYIISHSTNLYRFNLKINPILWYFASLRSQKLFNGRSVGHFYLFLLSVNCGHHRLGHKLPV